MQFLEKVCVNAAWENWEILHCEMNKGFSYLFLSYLIATTMVANVPIFFPLCAGKNVMYAR